MKLIISIIIASLLLSGAVVAAPEKALVSMPRPGDALAFLLRNHNLSTADGTLRILIPDKVFMYNNELINDVLHERRKSFYHNAKNLPFLAGVQLKVLPFQVDSYLRQYKLLKIVNPQRTTLLNKAKAGPLTRGQSDLFFLVAR